MLNKAQLIGRVGKDPEIRYLSSGDAVANFSLATSERYKDKQTGKAVEKTEWHNVSAFRRLAEIVGEYVRKGSLVYIEGKIQTSKHEKNGTIRYNTSIVADELKMLGGKGDSQQQHQQQPVTRGPTESKNTTNLDDLDDEIPF